MSNNKARFVNIAGVDCPEIEMDPEYRYKMPLLQTTANPKKKLLHLDNIQDIAKALHSPWRSSGGNPEEIVKYMAYELGVRGQCNKSSVDEKKKKGSKQQPLPKTTATLTGANHSTEALQQVVNQYIEDFVLCRTCRKPETSYRFSGKKKKQIIKLDCDGCGDVQKISPRAKDHRLCKYLLLQHETKIENVERRKNGNKKKDKKNNNSNKKKKEGKSDSEEDDGNKKKDNNNNSNNNKKKEEENSDSGEGDDEQQWMMDDKEATALAVKGVRTYLESHPLATGKEIADTVTNHQLMFALKITMKLHILTRAVLSEAIRDAASISEKIQQVMAPAVREILNTKEGDTETKRTIALQRQLIGALEVVASPTAATRKFFPLLLKQCYDQDVLEEDTILEWWADDNKNGVVADNNTFNDYYGHEVLEEGARKDLRVRAKPFVDWLVKAEEEESDEDE